MTNCSGSGLSSPFSTRMVSTMSSVALGPATRRAGSPGATLVMRKVSAAMPSMVPTRVASFRSVKLSMWPWVLVDAGSAYAPRVAVLFRVDPQGIEVNLAGEPDGAELEAFQIVAVRPAAILEHAEYLRLVGDDLRLDLRVKIGALVPVCAGTSLVDHSSNLRIVVERHRVILAPAILMILVGHRVRIGRDRRHIDRGHRRRGFHARAVGDHVRPLLRRDLDVSVQLLEVFEKHQADAARLLETGDVDVGQRDAAIRILRLRQIFLRLGHVLPRNVGDFDMAA